MPFIQKKVMLSELEFPTIVSLLTYLLPTMPGVEHRADGKFTYGIKTSNSKRENSI